MGRTRKRRSWSRAIRGRKDIKRSLSSIQVVGEEEDDNDAYDTLLEMNAVLFYK